MQEFKVSLHSFQQVQEFVKIASLQTFPVSVGNEDQSIDGSDLMGMFSLDYSRPLTVRPDCSPEDFLFFRQNVAKFLAL